VWGSTQSDCGRATTILSTSIPGEGISLRHSTPRDSEISNQWKKLEKTEEKEKKVKGRSREGKNIHERDCREM
jgi:hypothetical protein